MTWTSTRGEDSAELLGCDLTYDYVKIQRRLPHLILEMGGAALRWLHW